MIWNVSKFGSVLHILASSMIGSMGFSIMSGVILTSASAVPFRCGSLQTQS